MTNGPEIILSLESVTCDINNKRLLSIDQLDIHTGQLTGLLGPNGAGKSTLLKVISGDMPCRGNINFHGKSLRQWSPLKRARHLAVLPQASQLGFSFQANEVVALGLTPLTLSRTEGIRQVQLHMEQTDCSQFAKRSYLSLSGGERQRVQLARVLLQLSQAEQTPLLLLDEPTSAQDLGQQHKILSLAKQLSNQKNFAVITILHDLNQVLRYCKRCCLLKNGVIFHDGKPEELLDTDTIESYWQYRPERITLANGRIVLV